MKRKPLTTAALLAAATALPTLAEDRATPVQVNHEVVVVQNNGGDADQARRVVVVQADQAAAVPADVAQIEVEVVGEGGVDGAEGGAVRARVVMMDAEGNIIELDGDQALQWVEGENNIHIEMGELAVPGVEFIPGDDEDIRVFLRQLGERDIVEGAPINPPMVEATYLGLNCEPLDFDTAALLLVDEGTGLNVTFVAPDSPAAAAGLQAGDTLLTMGDQVLVNPEQMAVLIRTHEEGDEVTLRVIREGEEFDLTAELGTNTVPQLGPGGRNLSQFWNVERQGHAAPHGQFRVLPEGLHGNLALIDPQAEDVAQQIEMIQQLLADQLQAMPDLEGLQHQAEQMRERMRMHEIELMRMFEELDIDPAEFGHEQDLDVEFDGDAAMQIVWNDGEHTIQISGDGEGNQTLNVKDADGNELYDGPMPEGDALDELPEGVGDKVREMTEGQHFEFDIEAAPEAPEVPEAPAQDAPAADF